MEPIYYKTETLYGTPRRHRTPPPSVRSQSEKSQALAKPEVSLSAKNADDDPLDRYPDAN